MNEFVTALDIKRSLANTPQVTFEITDACNMKCRYCAYGEMYDNYDKRSNSLMKSTTVIHFLEYLSKLWKSPLSFSSNGNIYFSFYGGEPLLNFGLIEDVVSYTLNNDLGRKPTFTMTTNGLLLNKHIDYLVEHDFKILVSLDGNEFNNSYRVYSHGQPVFKKLICILDNINIQHPGFFRNNIQFNSVLHNRNSVQDIVSFIGEKYNKVPSIGELSSNGVRIDKLDMFQKMFKDSIKSAQDSRNENELNEILGTKGASYHNAVLFVKRFSPYSYDNYLELLIGKTKTKPIPTGTCMSFSKKVFVTVHGKILSCEKIGHDFSLGEVSSSVKIDFSAIAKDFNRRISKVNRTCNNCHLNGKACVQCMYFLPNLDEAEFKAPCHVSQEKLNKYIKEQTVFLTKYPKIYQKIINDIILK